MGRIEQNKDCSGRKKTAKTLLLLLLVGLSCFGFINPTFSQHIDNTVNQVPLPWYLSASPETVYTQVPPCWTTFTITVNGTSQGNIHILFSWLTVSSGNLYYDETYETKGQKVAGSFRFDVVVEGPPQTPTTHTLEVSAHDDTADNRNWFDFGYGALNQKVLVTIITPSSYPAGQYCAHYTYTLATTHATMTYTTIDLRSPTTTYTTYGTTTYGGGDWWWNWDWWRWWWIGISGEPFDFSLDATPTSQSIKGGQSASFTVTVKLLSGATQPVTLSLSGFPGGISYSFGLQSADPTFTSALQVSSQASLSPGTYTLTIIGTGDGKTHSTTVSLIVAQNKQSSSVSLSASPPSVKVGESVALGGALVPGLATTIELVYTRPDGFELTKHVTASTGAFSDAFKPDTPGSWSVKARWPGDADHYASESQPASFSVEGVPQTSQPFWEQIPPVAILVAILGVVILVAVVLLRRRPAKAETVAVAASKFCVKCGMAIPQGSKYCLNCGEKAQ